MSPFPRRSKINIQIADEIVEEFRQRAKETGDSVNKLIERALQEWLQQNPPVRRKRENDW